MYFKREIPVAGGVYRPLNVRQFTMITMGGFWPVILKLPDGRLGVVTRDGDFHIGEGGRLVFATFADGGESWSHATVISGDGPDNRNPAFGVAADGTLRGPEFWVLGTVYRVQGTGAGERQSVGACLKPAHVLGWRRTARGATS